MLEGLVWLKLMYILNAIITFWFVKFLFPIDGGHLNQLLQGVKEFTLYLLLKSAILENHRNS